METVVTPLNFGVIGLSPGNGHPYSWSAIFNGYDPEYMEDCGFPIIPRYLEKQRFPQDSIAEARVTHVWAQEKKFAEHIAKASLIPNVVAHYKDMIGEVDGILLARDDAETHIEFAAPFLNAGLPVYIDKPLALNIADAKRLLSMQRYPGQIFSCSALRYAKEFQMSPADWAHIGRLRHIHAIVPKDWNKYAIHVIEPLLFLSKDHGVVEKTQTWQSDDSTTVAVRFSSGLQALICAMGESSAPLALRLMGESGWKDLFFSDSFFAFRQALFEFTQGVISRDVRTDPESLLEIISLVELGSSK